MNLYHGHFHVGILCMVFMWDLVWVIGAKFDCGNLVGGGGVI